MPAAVAASPIQKDPGWNPGNGDSAGDPHLKTFDGFRFDFQQIGEYTLVRSTKDDFVVQVRQVPVPKSRAVSVNQAMATKIGGQRVTVSLENGAAVLRIDGTVVTGDPPAMKGGSIMRALTGYGTSYAIEWPDGTVVRAEQLKQYTINVRVRPSAARRGTLEGLLGNDDGAVDDDAAEPAALAEKWRVTQAASLFDYQSGQSSQTFVDPTFPDPGQTVPNREAADKACREEGITDPQLLHDCIVDFGVTNGFLFASQYAHQQKVLEARAALAPANATAVAAPKERVLTMAGTIADKSQPTQFTFDAQANDVIFLHQPDCVDRSDGSVIFFALVAPDGRTIDPGHPGCDIGRVSLPVAGTYIFKGNMAKNQIGKYSVPIRFVRHDRDAGHQIWRHRVGQHRAAGGARSLHVHREGRRPRADLGQGLRAEPDVYGDHRSRGPRHPRPGLPRREREEDREGWHVHAARQRRRRRAREVSVRLPGRVVTMIIALLHARRPARLRETTPEVRDGAGCGGVCRERRERLIDRVESE